MTWESSEFFQAPMPIKERELRILNKRGMEKYVGNMKKYEENMKAGCIKKYVGNTKKYAPLYMGRGTEKLSSV